MGIGIELLGARKFQKKHYRLQIWNLVNFFLKIKLMYHFLIA